MNSTFLLTVLAVVVVIVLDNSMEAGLFSKLIGFIGFIRFVVNAFKI